MDTGSNPSCPLCSSILIVSNEHDNEIIDYKCRFCFSKVDAKDLMITKRGIHPRIQKFIKESYHIYYSKSGAEIPPRYSRREFAFITQSGFMVRHLAFKKPRDINQYILSTMPLHCYYSSAYYEHPDMTPMKDKVEGWMGADLIFDLDADHLPGAEEMTFEQILDEIKGHAKRLIFEFLMNDFGFDPRHIELYFSGGRGYHIYVRNEDVWPMTAYARRQITDYVQGRGLVLDLVAPRKYDISPRVFPLDHGGWTSKLQISKRRIIKILKDMDNEPNINPLGKRTRYFDKIVRDNKLDISHNKCRAIIEELFEYDDNVEQMIESDFMLRFEKDKSHDSFYDILVAYGKINSGLETDAPVTTDTKRLIRLPGSLHGKTGMRVTRVDLDKIDDFKPLDDAIALNDDPINVKSSQIFELRMNGNTYRIVEGSNTLPRYAAYFCIMKKGCDIDE